MLNSPIRWVGGKSRLHETIIGSLPIHQTYIQPFAGGAWIYFEKPPSAHEVINDIDTDLTAFYRTLQKEPAAFIQSFDWELVSRAEFERLAQLDTAQLSDLERAHRFFYLIMAGWGGELNYPRFQTAINDGGHGNRLIGALQNLERRIMPAAHRLADTRILNQDWQLTINQYDQPDSLIYIDPPYPNNSVNYAHNMRDPENHQRLAERLFSAQCHWLLSSYDTPEIRYTYRHYDIQAVTFTSSMRPADKQTGRLNNKEVLIRNHPPRASLQTRLL